MSLYKLFFATDIHGSTACFRKFINRLRSDDPPSALIMGGDITGKRVIPLVEAPKSRYLVRQPNRADIEIQKADLSQFKQKLADLGMYSFECNETFYAKYSFDKHLKLDTAKRLQSERLTEWLEFAENKLIGKDTKVIINCGNDDDFFIDDILKSHDRFIFPEGRVVELNEHLTLISVGYSNPIPWECDRKVSEDDLTEKIALLANQVPSFEGCIFNFHCPPIDTGLDLAPELNTALQPQLGMTGVKMKHYGSTAVRDAILSHQPSLSLHGHIHDQHKIEKIGRTVCINPGSSYWSGRLQGAFATFHGDQLEGYALTYEQRSKEKSAEKQRVWRALLAAIPFAGPVIDSYMRQKEQDANTEALVRRIDASEANNRRANEAIIEELRQSAQARSKKSDVREKL